MQIKRECVKDIYLRYSGIEVVDDEKLSQPKLYAAGTCFRLSVLCMFGYVGKNTV